MIRALAAVALLFAAAAHAQENTPAQKEERTAVCTAQADDRNLKGAIRRSYMKECLKGGSTKQIAAEQVKILECTEAAEDQALVARERRRFMTECLRG